MSVVITSSVAGMNVEWPCLGRSLLFTKADEPPLVAARDYYIPNSVSLLMVGIRI